MEYNLILAGVGGQGILTIAQLITGAALRRGYHVKQSEVHGMSQRGGAVQSHVRLADHPVHSELIPLGEADLILAVEPLEALRYVQYLRPQRGAIVTSAAPVANISDYPPVEQVLARLRAIGRSVIVDAAKLAKQAGSGRAENVVMLGAASALMPLDAQDLLRSIHAAFAAKGANVLEANERAFQLGREQRDDPGESSEIDQILARAQRDGRAQLFEHEVYGILNLFGVVPPAHRLVPATRGVSADDLAEFSGERIVVKLVSAQVSHKSEAGGVAIVPRVHQAVDETLRQMTARYREANIDATGVLLVEHVEHDAARLGRELLVGVRATREFGPTLVAGIGGTDTEFLAERFGHAAAVAIAPATDCSAEAFLDRFRRTVAYGLLSGQVRGHERLLDDDVLVHCFAAFLAIAQRFCAAGQRAITELEVNPFAVLPGRLVPLDGRARIGELPSAAPARADASVMRLLEPRAIAVLGVSSKRANFGRIILNNVQRCGFPTDRLYIVKDGGGTIDGVRCYASLVDVPEPVDLLIAATGADQVPQVVRDALDSQRCASVILISGAVGEKEGTEEVPHALREMISAARDGRSDAPVFLGANSMGVRSRPGRYDTFFIPPHKLDPHARPVPRRLAIVSQSGAFIITRLSNLQFIDPAIAVSMGNQLDLTVGDFVRVIGRRGDIDCIGIYVEGFNDLDGLALLRAVRDAKARGQQVVFYKAGCTPAGRSAAQGHTASLAGDWDVCAAAVSAAGAIVATSFTEFEQLIELSIDLHDKPINGRSIAAVSNAGFETVGMADALRDTALSMPPLSEQTRRRIEQVLDEHGLSRLVNPRNPLDLTPMADDDAYEQAVRVLLEAPEFDAVAVACVPMSPQLLTTPSEIPQPGSIANRLVRLFEESAKPLVAIFDSAAPYDDLAATVRRTGVPVFRRADEAIDALGRYLSHRCDPRPMYNPVR